MRKTYFYREKHLVAIFGLSFALIRLSPLQATEVVRQEEHNHHSIYHNVQQVGSVIFMDVNEPSIKTVTVDLSNVPNLIQNIDGIVKMGFSVNLSKSDVTYEDILKLVGSGLNIRELDLSENPLTKKEVELLSTLEHLEILSLNACTLYDSGLEYIGKLRSLKYLSLDYNGITPQGISYLTELQDLEELDLGSNYITNGCVKILAQFPKLRKLVVSMNELDDECVQDLMIPTLQYLDIRDNNFTEAGIKKLTALAQNTNLEVLS